MESLKDFPKDIAEIYIMAHHNSTGALGEKMAIAWLVAKGFEILHQNWRHSHWEVDIIASLNNVLHFIEIKTRRTATFGYPEEDVTKKKTNQSHKCF